MLVSVWVKKKTVFLIKLDMGEVVLYFLLTYLGNNLQMISDICDPVTNNFVLFCMNSLIVYPRLCTSICPPPPPPPPPATQVSELNYALTCRAHTACAAAPSARAGLPQGQGRTRTRPQGRGRKSGWPWMCR